MMEIRSKARRLKSKEPNLGLIVVDYIQLMTSGASVENRVQEVSQISRNLKVLARDLDVPVLALSQLSRAVEQRHDKRPILSDLRESGSIEQDADLVFFIYRDEYYNDETDQQGIAEIHLAKHRNGPTGTEKVAFLSRYAKFADLAAAVGHTPSVPATVIVGAQWGDEGKGKIVDLLAQHSDVVCRYQGGPNAGHTIVADGQTYKFRHMPSGILWGKECVLGAGCVVDPAVFIEELDDLDARGLSTERVHLSGNAQLIMPWHVALDRASERRLGKLQIGTTRRGIGPAYGDKAARLGIRVQDLLDPKILRQKIEVALAEKNHWLEQVYGAEPIDLEDVSSRYESYAQRLRPFIADTSLLVDRALRDGRFVLFEGAQGTLLDLDHGTYPFVTSSNPVAGAAATGIGIGPNRIDAVLGVAKAYLTRVGEGPFPTEIEGGDQERVRELGGEYGTVTGRERRCGWLDLVGLRYAARLNGFTSLALTKLDVLSTFAELPVCVRYRLRDGTETEEFPAHQSDFHHCEPVYEVLPGWEEPLDGMDDVSRLPEAARRYVSFVEEQLEVEVSLIGTGAAREHVLAQRGLEAIARP